MNTKRIFNISVLIFCLVVLGPTGLDFSSNPAMAQEQSLADVELYSTKDVVCVIAKIKIGLSLKPGSDPSGTGGIEFSLGRRDKCKSGVKEECSETSCK